MAKTIRPKVLRAFACRQDILLKLTCFNKESNEKYNVTAAYSKTLT